jgi:hypothetical protein
MLSRGWTDVFEIVCVVPPPAVDVELCFKTIRLDSDISALALPLREAFEEEFYDTFSALACCDDWRTTPTWSKWLFK